MPPTILLSSCISVPINYHIRLEVVCGYLHVWNLSGLSTNSNIVIITSVSREDNNNKYYYQAFTKRENN